MRRLALLFLSAMLLGGCVEEDSCFVAGTQIDTPGGPISIEAIEVGTEVYAYDERRGERVVRPVVQTFAHHGADVRMMRLEDGRALGVTDEHPFYQPLRGTYVPAEELQAQGILLSFDAGVTNPAIRGFGRSRRVDVVYNFEVADFHNYFVEGILVHNKRPVIDAGARDAIPDRRVPDAVVERDAVVDGDVLVDAGSDAGSDATMDAGDATMDGASDAIADATSDTTTDGGDSGSDGSRSLPTGETCMASGDCISGICWDFRDIDPLCGGRVCSESCTMDTECQDIARAQGASQPLRASCDRRGQCDFVGTGLGIFFCA